MHQLGRQLQTEVAGPIPFGRGSPPGSAGSAAQGPRSQGAQVDTAYDPVSPLGQAEVGRAQDSRTLLSPGTPKLCRLVHLHRPGSI